MVDCHGSGLGSVIAGCRYNPHIGQRRRGERSLRFFLTHCDPRMTLRVYTDATGKRPQTRMAGLLGDDGWAMGRKASEEAEPCDGPAAASSP